MKRVGIEEGLRWSPGVTSQPAAAGRAFSRGLWVGALLALWIQPLQAAPLRGVEHVVVIGGDGMGSVAFRWTNAPVMRRLMIEGAYTLKARGVMPTSSSPNWASMISGAGPEQHGITSNEWETNRFEIVPLVRNQWGYFPTIFGVLRDQRPYSEIVCVHDWQGFGRLVEPGVSSVIEHVKGSPSAAARAIELIKTKKPAFTFIHFDDIDHAGHTFGWQSELYYREVDVIDALVGDILRALEEAGMSRGTIVLITADHGGRGTQHGGATQEEIEIPWIIHGPGVAGGRVLRTPVNTYDTAPTIAWVLGLKPPPAWIGRPVKEAFGF